MTLLLLAVLPSVVALVLVTLLGLAVIWRTWRGERWQVSLLREEIEAPGFNLGREARVHPAVVQPLVQALPVPSAS